MPIVSHWKVQHNGTEYEPGTVITVLSDQEEQDLVDKGYAEFVDVEQSFPLTPDAFAKLPAGEQKELLEANGMTPGSNAGERLEQFTTWLEQQADNHDGT